ncbi:MAG: hypothetical protein OXH98_10460 [Caldilineaceae bacterium]|nr:hypothetical protein [Caldilineaceae bacterium]
MVIVVPVWLEWITKLAVHKLEYEFYGRQMHFAILRESIASGMLYVGMALATVYSVRHRAVWPVFAAILAYMVTVIMQAIAPEHRFSHTISSLLFTLLESETTRPFVASFMVRIGNENMQTLHGFLALAPTIVAALPSLVLALYLRKAFIRASSETPETAPKTP